MDIQNMDLIEQARMLATTWGLKVIGAVALLIIGVIAAKMIRGMVRKTLERANVDKTLAPFISKLVYYLTLAAILVAVMAAFGVETTSFVAVLGAAGFAVGLAMQGTLSNFSAGVMLLVFRPFQVGDFVEVGGTAGSVEEIGVFSTTLNTPDNVRIVAPNSTVYGTTIKNFAANDTRRNDLVIGVSYDDDLGQAADVIRRVIDADSRVLKDPEPLIAVAELADSSVNFVVRPWCKKEDYWGLRFDLLRQLKEQLETAGCSIPYPQSDVHLQQPPTAA